MSDVLIKREFTEEEVEGIIRAIRLVREPVVESYDVMTGWWIFKENKTRYNVTEGSPESFFEVVYFPLIYSHPYPKYFQTSVYSAVQEVVRFLELGKRELYISGKCDEGINELLKLLEEQDGV